MALDSDVNVISALVSDLNEKTVEKPLSKKVGRPKGGTSKYKDTVPTQRSSRISVDLKGIWWKTYVIL